MKKLLLLCLIITGCNQPRVPLDPEQVVTAREVRRLLGQDNQARIILMDATYCMPSEAWIEWVNAAHRRYLRMNGLINWLPFFDCDNRSRDFGAYCALKYAQQASRDWPQGIAVYLRAYQRDKKDNEYGGWHAINAIILEDMNLADWEPQTGKWTDLTPTERASTTYTGD